MELQDPPLRVGAQVNAMLILRKGDEVLMHLRQNSGYFDGHYGFISGHVEVGEGASSAMCREAEEEAGITIDPAHLRLVHVTHRQTNRLNVDLFFMCEDWKGTITNREPTKCAGLEFHPIDNLPENTIDYIEGLFIAIREGTLYSEAGF